MNSSQWKESSEDWERVEYFEAVTTGNREKLRDILRRHSNFIHIRNQDDDMALHVATIHNQVESVRILLSFRAYINSTGCSNRTALHYSVCDRHLEITALLLDNDAVLYETDSLEETVIHKAATNGDEACLNLLLSHQRGLAARQIIDHTNVLGSTALHNAANYGHFKIVQLLINFGANPLIEGKCHDNMLLLSDTIK